MIKYLIRFSDGVAPEFDDLGEDLSTVHGIARALLREGGDDPRDHLFISTVENARFRVQ
jgi:hypothetical protein